jgi:hypothetical protein
VLLPGLGTENELAPVTGLKRLLKLFVAPSEINVPLKAPVSVSVIRNSPELS